MNMLITTEEFDKLKGKEIVPLKCKHCNNAFHKISKTIIRRTFLDPNYHSTHDFCSRKCYANARSIIQTVACDNCGKFFKKYPKKIKKYKTHFCCCSCTAIYHSKHKTCGYTRSKLEKWLEPQLILFFPEITILFNDKTTIKSELDICIPSLSLAFEINGITHYKPIYGQKKFDRVKSKDEEKFLSCLNKGISLYTLDVSTQSNFKPEKSKGILNLIKAIIEKYGAIGENSTRI